MNFWPYRILKRSDNDIESDLKKIMSYFAARGVMFDTVVFVPMAGCYLAEVFRKISGDFPPVHFVTVRRGSTTAKDNVFKRLIFSKRWLSNLLRHVEVLWRLIKFKLGINQRMVGDLGIDWDTTDKNVLVIDDSVDTGTTLSVVRSVLLSRGAASVTTACISNHLVPDKVQVDYSVYRYRLLRTKNSRDYYAT